MTSFGPHVALLRRRAGLTQNDLALAVGLRGNAHLSRIERGQVLPTAELLAKLAHALGVDAMGLRLVAEGEANIRGLPAPLQEMEREAEELRAEMAAHIHRAMDAIDDARRKIAATVHASRLNLFWDLSQKIELEARANEVWVFTPHFNLETTVAALRETVARNLERGAIYRYLIPDGTFARRRLALLRAQLPAAARLEVRLAPRAIFAFASEIVLYEPRDLSRRIGLWVAPSHRPDVDVLLGTAHAERITRAYVRHWLQSRVLRP